MNERLVYSERAVIAHDQSPEVAQPGAAAPDDPALLVASQHSTVLRRRPVPVRTVRGNQNHAATPQPCAQRIAVVPLCRQSPARAFVVGVHQLVVPLAHDQPDNAVRVCRLGVGDMLLPKNYRIKTVFDRLHRLLESPAVADNCRRRAADLATNTALERTCDLIEQLGSSGNS